MAVVLGRTTLNPEQTVEVATAGLSDITIHVPTGQVEVEAFLDGAQADGYRFKVNKTAVVLVNADKLIIEGRGAGDSEVEVYVA